MLSSEAYEVGVTASLIAEAASSPLHLKLHNESGQAIYLGDASVTPSIGFHIDQHEHLDLTLYPGNKLYACTTANTATLIYLGQQL